MAPGVIDCSHRRLTGCLALAFCAIRRKISSPSRPASHALMRVETSLRLISLFNTLRRASVFGIGLSAKYGGIIGKCAKLHLPRFTSNSSGTAISSKWPTADDRTYSSDSKYSSCLVKPPSVFAISFATEGFSAMMRVFVIFFSLEKCSRIVSACASYSALPGADAFVCAMACDLWSCQAANDKRLLKNSASYLQARMRRRKHNCQACADTVHGKGDGAATAPGSG